MAELADALDLGSSVPDVQVQVLSPAACAPDHEKSMVWSLFFCKKIFRKPGKIIEFLITTILTFLFEETAKRTKPETANVYLTQTLKCFCLTLHQMYCSMKMKKRKQWREEKNSHKRVK